MTKPKPILPLLLGIQCVAFSCTAQWTSQTIPLRPGWNAVFLEVQPEPSDCDTLLAGLPIESVWAWNRRFSSVQFIQDANTLVPGQPDWLTYLPASHEARAAVNLFILQGDRPYLINVAANATPLTWTVRGTPSVRSINWISDSLNLVGFHVNPERPPSFASFFASSSAHAGKPIYRLDASGRWQQVANPAAATMVNGEAFWIQCAGQSDFAGPLGLTLDQRTGLDYGRTLTEQTVRIRNASTVAQTIQVRELASDEPPNREYPALAGGVPLSYFKMNLTNNEYGWIQFPNELSRTNLAPGEEWALRLEVRRADMTEFAPDGHAAGFLYLSLLQVTGSAGARWIVPVTARGLQAYLNQGAVRPLALAQANNAALTTPHKRSGLWVGSAVINKVSQPSSIGQPEQPVATASEFQFRLLVHVDANGQARLLQKVLQMWREGTYRPDPGDPTKQIVDEPGRFVLVTDDRLIPQFTGATLRDGQPVGRRMSSAAFGFPTPVVMTGAGDFGTNSVSCSITLGYDDPLNPFKHRYHPDHDNLDERFEQVLPEGKESFTILRDIALEFTAEDPSALSLAGWGDNQLGGNYRETITGIHRSAIHLQGYFRLHHVSRVASLNDGIHN
ncbi:MAG: hypothetical protein AB9869_28595 [Verrucomicrobiia bacterium]